MGVFTIETPTGQKLDIEADNENAALAGAQQWHAENTSKVNTVEDVAKSAAIGVPKAVIGAAGIPGGVGNAASSATDAAFNSLGAPQSTIDEFKGNVSKAADYIPGLRFFRDMPDAATIQKKVEETTGPFYQPQTKPGEYAQSISENTTGALTSPGGILPKVAQGVGAGVGSQGFADYLKGTPFEPYARLLGGVVGGGVAAGGSKVVEGVRNASASSTTGANLGNELGGGSVKGSAVNRLAQNVADEGLTPASVSQRIEALGPEAMVLDMGKQLQGRAEFMANTPGKAQNTVLNAVEGRTGEFGQGARERIGDTLDQHLGPSRNVVHVLDDVDETVKKYATPAYEKVMADYPVINVPPEITNRPAVAQAMKGAEPLAKNYGEKLSTSETKTILQGDGYHIAEDIVNPAQTSLKYWDYVKKGMDQRIDGFMRSGHDLSGVEKADLGGLLDAKKSLVSYLDGVTGGQYENARRIAATKPQLHEAMDLGRSTFNSKMLPEEFASHIQGLSIPEQQMVQVGARRELERTLDSVRNDGAKARNFLDTNNNIQKIEYLFGSDAARAIERRVGAENQFQNATQEIARNSATARRLAGARDTATPTLDTHVTLTGLAGVPFKAGLNAALEHGMAGTRSDIARVLTAKGGQVDPVIDMLMNYNAKRASNAATPLKTQAAALARALISGAASQ